MSLEEILKRFEAGFKMANLNLNQTWDTGVANYHFEDFERQYGVRFGLVTVDGNVKKNLRDFVNEHYGSYYAGHVIAYVMHPLKFVYTLNIWHKKRKSESF